MSHHNMHVLDPPFVAGCISGEGVYTHLLLAGPHVLRSVEEVRTRRQSSAGYSPYWSLLRSLSRACTKSARAAKSDGAANAFLELINDDDLGHCDLCNQL